jgi:hypothetical protein
MLYLLWGLINLALIIGFFILCFKATTLVKVNIGKPAALLFAVGLLSFLAVPDRKQNTEFIDLSLPETPAVNSSSNEIMNTIHVTLQDNLVSDFDLYIIYKRKSPDFINEPVKVYSSSIGLACGINWIPSQYLVEKTPGNKEFSYLITGAIEWKILRFTIFSQQKSYKGRVAVK